MVTLVSGNKQKIQLYAILLAEYGVSFSAQKLVLDEVQSDSLPEIVERKALHAFEQLQQPVFVQDAGWAIPALKGFPGPFMKYMNHWLSSEDFLALMRDKIDKSVSLLDYFGCVDAAGKFTMFEATYSAHFIEMPYGDGSSIDRIVALDTFSKPLSLTSLEERRKVFAKAEVWESVAEWIQKQG